MLCTSFDLIIEVMFPSLFVIVICMVAPGLPSQKQTGPVTATGTSRAQLQQAETQFASSLTVEQSPSLSLSLSLSLSPSL